MDSINDTHSWDADDFAFLIFLNHDYSPAQEGNILTQDNGFVDTQDGGYVLRQP